MYMVCVNEQGRNFHVKDMFHAANGGKRPFNAWDMKLNAIFG